MLSVYYVARNTLREVLREPVFFLLLITAVSLTGLFPSLSMFVFREQIKLVTDSSMATTLVFGLFAAVISAGSTITREMNNGTLTLMLSKPIPRWKFVLGKVLGIISALTIFVFACNCATLVSLKVAKDQFQLEYVALYCYYGIFIIGCLYGALRNYLSRKSFCSESIYACTIILSIYTIVLYSFSTDASDENMMPLKLILPALVMLFFAVWSMAAITIALSTRLELISNMTACSIIFILGLVSDYYFGGTAGDNVIFPIIYAAIPNWQLFWLADALSSRKQIPLNYVFFAAAYAFLYLSMCCFLAISMFSRREIAEDIG